MKILTKVGESWKNSAAKLSLESPVSHGFFLTILVKVTHTD